MNRRIPLILLLAGCAAAGPAGAAVRWGVETGAHLTRLTGSPYSNGSDHPLSFSGSFGPFIESEVRPGIQFALGLALDRLADREGIEVVIVDASTAYHATSTTHTRLHSLVIPATFRAEVFGPWRVSAGPEVRVRIHADQKLDQFELAATPAAQRPAVAFAQIYELESATGAHNVTRTFAPVSLGLQGGIGYVLPAGLHQWRFDLRWSEGVTSATRTTAYDPRRARSLQLSVGWLN